MLYSPPLTRLPASPFSFSLSLSISTATTLYLLSTIVTISPLIFVLSATAYVLHSALLAMVVFVAGIVCVAGFVGHCVVSAQRMLENGMGGKAAGEVVEFEGCTVRPMSAKIGGGGERRVEVGSV